MNKLESLIHSFMIFLADHIFIILHYITIPPTISGLYAVQFGPYLLARGGAFSPCTVLRNIKHQRRFLKRKSL